MPSPLKLITTWSIGLNNPNLAIERHDYKLIALMDVAFVAMRQYERSYANANWFYGVGS